MKPDDAAATRNVLPPGLADDADVAHVADFLRQGASAWRAISPYRVATSLGRVHRQWAARRSACREEAVTCLHRETDYATQVLDESLRHFFRGLSTPRLRAAIRQDLQPGPSEILVPPTLTWVVASGNVPVASLPALVASLLVRSPCLFKSSSDEPSFPALYAQSLHELAPELSAHLAVMNWRGGDAAAEEGVGSRAEAVVAYGSDKALDAIRKRVNPKATWIGFGHRVSFGYVGSGASLKEAAKGAACDVCIYDQQGCFSPVVYFCEAVDGAPARFAELLAGEMSRLGRRWPRRPLGVGEAAAVNRWRAGVELEVALGCGRWWRGRDGVEWTVALMEDATIAAGMRDRSVVVTPVLGPDELPLRLAPAAGSLSTASLAAPANRIAALTGSLIEAGALRVCAPGQMQFPDPLAAHDGVRLLSVLVRRARVGQG